MIRILYLRPGKLHNPAHPAREGSPLFREIARLAEFDDVPYDSSLPEERWAELIRGYDVLLTMWQSPAVPESLADDSGRLRYVCHVTGEMRGIVPERIVASPRLTVTNWGDAPAFQVAEGALSLLLSGLKSLPLFVANQRAGGIRAPSELFPGSLYGLPVGIYGMGVIAREFVRLLRPFGARMRAFDPYVRDFPEDVERAASLEELFRGSKAIVIHAGLSPETRHSVDARLLSLLPDHAVVVNTARGGLIDQDAMFAEILSGRLRAALDVLDGDDTLPAGHPVRQCPNLLLTNHSIMTDSWSADPAMLDRKALVCLDNLRRFIAGEPLRFVMTPERYKIST